METSPRVPANGVEAQNVGSPSVNKDLEGKITTHTPYRTLSVLSTGVF